MELFRNFLKDKKEIYIYSETGITKMNVETISKNRIVLEFIMSSAKAIFLRPVITM